jgi:hypothetical protein
MAVVNMVMNLRIPKKCGEFLEKLRVKKFITYSVS